jgi:hypothetical protein
MHLFQASHLSANDVTMAESRINLLHQYSVRGEGTQEQDIFTATGRRLTLHFRWVKVNRKLDIVGTVYQVKTN